MRTITVFYDGSHYIYRWLKPLFVARNEFKKLGFEVKFHDFLQYLPIFKGGEKRNILNAQKGEGDIAFLAFHHSTSYFCLCSENERKQLLGGVRKHYKMIAWLDTADSTGCGMFDVLPYVDVYFKKQIYKDKSLYAKDLYGSRLFCDYYHNKLQKEDPELVKRTYPIMDLQYVDKIQISWNVGLADLFAKGYRLLMRPFGVGKPNFVSPDSPEKNLDVHFRGSGWSPIAGYQRAKCKELIANLTTVTHPDVNSQVPYKEYIAEIKRAKAVLSPFGWGEICGRDFEAFAYGATLIKPSMDHCVTYPNWYQPYKTYVPVDWDFSNFDEIISKLDTEQYRIIAQQGFEMFKYYKTSEEARLEFAKHIIKGINLEQ